MFEKGDYVQSVNYGYIVLVDKVSGDRFSGIVVEGGDKFHKTGSTHDNWGIEYFKKINYKKHEESENDYHIRDIYVPKYINPDIANETLIVGMDFAEGYKELIKQDFALVRNDGSWDLIQISMPEFLGINKNDTEEREMQNEIKIDNLKPIRDTGMKVGDFDNFMFEFSEAVKRGRKKAEESLKKHHNNEDKMENKIKIDDKVILRTDIAFQVPFGVTKGTILNVDLIEGDKARVSTPVVSFVVPLELLIKVEEEKETKEDVRVVRKLEDLDGLENGSGLKISSIKDNMNRYTIRTIMPESKSIITEWVIDKIEHVFDKLKYMGFEFEYKPLRTKEEVLEEIYNLPNKSFSKKRVLNYYIYLDHNDNKYKPDYCDSYETLGVSYMTQKEAVEYCNELNEIIRADK